MQIKILHAESHLNGLREAFNLQAVGMSSQLMDDVDEWIAASAARFATVAEGAMRQQIEGVPGRMQRLGRMRGARDTAIDAFDAAYTALQHTMIDANFLLEEAHASAMRDATHVPGHDDEEVAGETMVD